MLQTVDKLDENRVVYSPFLVGVHMGLLISIPGASLSAGLALSLLVASSCGVSPVQLIPQESARLPLQSTGLLNITWNYIEVYFEINTFYTLGDKDAFEKPSFPN
ncbi:hypothetical protein [Mesobacillus foraminis]|uniref:hypothetical protein n=1 Tax=Mesobacillus foraminis TaxID=279826 RepID=UPI0013CF08E8|nr:hypothetical protein [Mesobacillus foraminis]